jgi:hypothetical protein
MRIFVDVTAGNHVADGRPGQSAHGDLDLDERDARMKRLGFRQPRPRARWLRMDLSGAAQAAF